MDTLEAGVCETQRTVTDEMSMTLEFKHWQVWPMERDDIPVTTGDMRMQQINWI